MAAIEQCGKKFLMRCVCASEVTSNTQTFTRKTDAQAWAKAIETDLLRGAYVPTPKAKRCTVAEMIDRYIKHTLL